MADVKNATELSGEELDFVVGGGSGTRGSVGQSETRAKQAEEESSKQDLAQESSRKQP